MVPIGFDSIRNDPDGEPLLSAEIHSEARLQMCAVCMLSRPAGRTGTKREEPVSSGENGVQFANFTMPKKMVEFEDG